MNKSWFATRCLTVAAVLFLLVGFGKPAAPPTLYLIGDSTVNNNGNGQMGWGNVVASYFDTTKIKVRNNAKAGRSTRTFITEGRWEKTIAAIKPGDFLIMQFGHNEGSAPDTTKAGRRGVLRGTGDETKALVWPDGHPETVNTYGWYLRKFIREAMAKGATPVVCSMIPRNEWKDGKVIRASNDFGKWAQEVAQQEGVVFINLNEITALKYDKLGPDEVKKFFPGDHTHTNEAGARLNAESVVDGIRSNKKLALNKYLAKN
ncbi:rhamnogalacturonan acetylesterase [Hymenobacter sp. BT770]|uniref:rhamnogalacturonan acetylesterase n=1 Tax=Hymenobacter sp. BT770 TaxID=2886942 RepID=UPI001D13010B|nr:rhamnogalacturonan acetylesterase [Hymenobacter sp. BT770]MCC3154964.1 rhamnogalacturonan acetylesterase [Hymenobacter sp. BT770]MDO3416860.1 rhamnogalacturonan acetylesterase [Hymenobacter sp. BT770]